jgi:hypothetical protein
VNLCKKTAIPYTALIRVYAQDGVRRQKRCMFICVFKGLILQGELTDCLWNVMAHAQKPDFVLRRKGRVHLNRQGHQFSRLLADEVCASTVVMLDTPCSEVVWRVLVTHSIRQFPLHFPSRALQCAITFQLDSTTYDSLRLPCAKATQIWVLRFTIPRDVTPCTLADRYRHHRRKWCNHSYLFFPNAEATYSSQTLVCM